MMDKLKKNMVFYLLLLIDFYIFLAYLLLQYFLVRILAN